LDLYNDTQLEKFIRKIAERLEVGTSVTAGTLAELTQALENYRLEKIKEQNNENAQPVKPLTEKEKAEAIKNLQHETLLEQTIQDLAASGIQGEAENALILLLAMTSRKTPDPISVICLARSGAGKSYLMEKVANCIPEEDKKEHTQFTGNSFYYYKREEIRNKVFVVKDLEGALSVLFPMRELQSEKKISKTITRKGRDGKLETITLVVEGPVSVIACTTKESVYEDNANRSILIYLDDSKEQDERIMNYQKRYRAGLIDSYQEKEIQTKLQQMQKVLEPIKVINPFAPIIEVPQEVFKKRRTLPMLLNFIEAITFYNQYQREQTADQSTGEVQIETHPNDIEWGFKLLSDVLFRKSDELSGAVRDFYEWLQNWNSKRETPEFLAGEVRQENKMHPRTLNRYLQELIEYGYIEITGGKKQRTGYIYTLTPTSGRKALEERISSQIKAVMQKVWKAYEQKNKKKKG
jgi:DNA-binding MarR family transcriptional regulator